MHKTKTLLFGEGEGSKQFRINESNTRTFLAYIDNNPKKHGTIVEDLLIVSPLEINNYDFDEIIITTQWAEEVKQQLLSTLNINEELIAIPKKSLLKKIEPFRDQNTIQFARNIITTLSSEAIKDNIPLSLDFGTLLGIVRDEDIIPWDDDIDFALPYEFSLNEEWIESTLNKVPDSPLWIIERQTNNENEIISYQFKFKNIQQTNYNYFITSISLRKEKGNISIHLPSLGKWYAPSKHFKKLEKIEWKNTFVITPSEYREYLSFLYGKWTTPKPNMTMEDYNNLGEVSFEDVNQANLQVEKIKRNFDN